MAPLQQPPHLGGSVWFVPVPPLPVRQPRSGPPDLLLPRGARRALLAVAVEVCHEYIVRRHAQVPVDVESVVVCSTLWYARVVECAHLPSKLRRVPVVPPPVRPRPRQHAVARHVWRALHPGLVLEVPEGVLVAHLTKPRSCIIHVILARAEAWRGDQARTQRPRRAQRPVHDREDAHDRQHQHDRLPHTPSGEPLGERRDMFVSTLPPEPPHAPHRAAGGARGPACRPPVGHLVPCPKVIVDSVSQRVCPAPQPQARAARL
mmetsp:Transcript_16792/g.38759  ORF Transcript_16792/g.38759 Transcript_16792/m.38759 type:complete len:262 (+) Transcript_16792:488-1273(+)